MGDDSGVPNPVPKKARRPAGHLYRRGRMYWTKYYVNGRPVYESTGQTKESPAQRVLNERLGRIATGQPIMPRLDRIPYAEVAQDLRQHYASSGDRDLDEAGWRLAHLDRFFQHTRVAAIGPADITRYTVERQKAEASNGTINRELAVLGRMLRLAYENGKLARLPLLRKLKEAAPRQGFFERHEYEAVRRHLRPDLQVAAAIAYTYGWRMQSEVLTLERRHLDLLAGTLRLDPGMTKNDEARVVYLTRELAALLTAQVERVDGLQRQTGRIIPFLFPHPSGRFRGQRIDDFRKAWATACRRAGVPGRLRHDFRRTAVRNMEREGVPRSVATKLTGHKTEAVYRRYAIVSDADLKAAAARLDGYNGGDNRGIGLDGGAVTL
jgi:integrase